MLYSRQDLRNQLKGRQFAPVYVLFGPETHLRDVAAKTIANLSFAPGDLRDFNETTFTLNTEGNLERALAAARQLPMLAAKRIVLITDLRVSASGFRDTLTEAHEPILSSYLADPSPQTIIIFLADELNGVRKMGRFLRESVAAVEFAPPKDIELRALARKEFETAGVTIDEPTMDHFLSLIGSDVRRMTNEIKKLSTACLPEGRISFDLIDAIVPNSKELTNFRLTEQIIAGRSGMAIQTLNKILNDGAEPIALLGLLSFNYRRLLMAKDLMDSGLGRREVASSLKLRYDEQETICAAAGRAKRKNLFRAMQRLAETDIAIKSSSGGPDRARLQLEVLVSELVRL